MDNARKKDLVREYKERKTRVGVYAVRFGDAVWVGPSRNLDKEQNSLLFQLKAGGHPNKALQAAWQSGGADGFGFEVLEEVTDENPEMVLLLLKERTAHWRTELGAGKAVG